MRSLVPLVDGVLVVAAGQVTRETAIPDDPRTRQTWLETLAARRHATAPARAP